jgi:hypothetical protein
MIKESEKLENKFREEFQTTAAVGSTGNVYFVPLVFDQRTFKRLREKKHPRTKLMLLADVSVVDCKFVVPKNTKSNRPRMYSVSSDIPCGAIVLAIAEKANGMMLRVGDRNSVGQYLIRLCALQCPIIKRTGKDKFSRCVPVQSTVLLQFLHVTHCPSNARVPQEESFHSRERKGEGAAITCEG